MGSSVVAGVGGGVAEWVNGVLGASAVPQLARRDRC